MEEKRLQTSTKERSSSKGGQKGKMFAVFDDETQSWWYTEVDDHQAVEVSEEAEDVMVISCVLDSHGDSWLHETGEDLDLIEENEPNTHVTDTHVMSHVMVERGVWRQFAFG